jgi:hypothetical protein
MAAKMPARCAGGSLRHAKKVAANCSGVGPGSRFSVMSQLSPCPAPLHGCARLEAQERNRRPFCPSTLPNPPTTAAPPAAARP